MIGRSAQLDDAFPKLTIGRSRRGWFWASLAIAAALLVMAFQPVRDGVEQPQAVALREEQVVREEVGRGRATSTELEIRTLGDGLATSVPSDGALTVAGPIAPTDAERTIERAESRRARPLSPRHNRATSVPSTWDPLLSPPRRPHEVAGEGSRMPMSIRR